MHYKKKGFEWDQYATFVELMADSCSKHSDLAVFSWKKGRKIIEKTYQEWKEDLLLTAGKIAKLDASHIGVVSDLTYESILSIYAIIVAGKVVVPLEASQSKEIYEKYVSKADVDLILYTESAMDEKPENCKLMLIDELVNWDAEGLKEWPTWEKNRPACIFFTSGTSGQNGEKSCVLLSQENIATTNADYPGPVKRTSKAETIMYLPMYHVFAVSGLIGCMSRGYKSYLSKGAKYLSVELLEYSPDFLLSVPVVTELLMKGIQRGIKSSGKEKEVLKGAKLTRLFAKLKIDIAPKIFKEIYDGIGGNLRVLHVSGAAISQKMIDFFEDFGIYLLDGYGMTEASGVVAKSTFPCRRPGSVGIVLPYNEVKIVDGEIWLRGINIMLGYYKDEEATKRVMEDGWLKTGDLGYLDEDGYLYITGRKKNLIILSNGVNISPEEIEKELLKSQYIQEVIVREKDDHIHADIYAGELKEAEIIQKKEQIQEEIKEFNYSNSVYNRIVSWDLREVPFEKTATMKIKR